MKLFMKYYDLSVFFIIKLLAKVGVKNKITFLRKYSLESNSPHLFNPMYKINAEKNNLTKIANHYRTDKGDIKHGYTYIYEQYLNQLRNITFDMLEIGVANGSSIQMWKDYFQNASIVGIDIEESCSKLFYNEPRIEILIGDSNSYKFKNRSFQIIVDDGSHLPCDIIKTFNNLWRNLKDGGFYIIEDLACTHNEVYCRQFMEKFHNIDLNEDFVERNKFINFINSLIMDMDLEYNDIAFINFYKQCCIIKKK